jgi:hypothetical protein
LEFLHLALRADFSARDFPALLRVVSVISQALGTASSAPDCSRGQLSFQLAATVANLAGLLLSAFPALGLFSQRILLAV